MARTQGEAFAGGKGESEDAARRSFAASPIMGVLAAATTQLSFLADEELRDDDERPPDDVLPRAAGFFAAGFFAAGFFAAGFFAAGFFAGCFRAGAFGLVSAFFSAGFTAPAAGLRESSRTSVTSRRVSPWRWPPRRR